MNLSITEIRRKNKIPIYSQIEKMNPYHCVLWAGIVGNSECSGFERSLAETIEESSGYQLTRRSIALRDICCELEKVHWYLKNFEILFAQFNDHILNSEISYLKFCLEDCFENWSGARLMPRLVCLGGVNRDIKLGHRNYISEMCKSIREELLEIKNYILYDPILRSRLIDIDEEMEKLPINFKEVIFDRGMDQLLSNEKLVDLLREFDKKSNLSFLLQKENISAYEFFHLSFLQLLGSLQWIESSLRDLPEGDHRVFIDHLHIPGNYFFHQKFQASSGLVYSYYCSGKIRFSSFSSRMLGRMAKQNILSLSKPTASLLGLDIIQGVNCDTLI